jgi:hypothetical protein
VETRDENAPGVERVQERERFARGLLGYHDPSAGFVGARPALSALTAFVARQTTWSSGWKPR